jgi:hypothetical protein
VLYEKPDNSFVAQFIGENNQLEGKVKSINGNSCVITTESGDDIDALKVNVNNVGDVSTISLRPERVAINSAEKFENVFDAKIKELIYLGDHIRTRVEICGNDQFIVKVPKELTNGRSIVSVLNLISNDNFNSNSGIGMVDTQEVFTKMANNLGSVIIAQTTRLELIADNTILVSEPSVYLLNCYLRCVIENDDNMGNLNPRSYIAFSRLVELAVKSYIYNYMVVKMDRAQLYNGHELGSIKDVIDGYSDSESMYREYLREDWRKVAFLNNSLSTENYITSMFGNVI